MREITNSTPVFEKSLEPTPDQSFRNAVSQALHSFDVKEMEFSSVTGSGSVGNMEKQFAEYLGVSHVIGVSSGTAALRIALEACGVGPASEVITSAYDWGAATAAIRSLGATPIFVDIDQELLTVDPVAVSRAVTTATSAIVVTHIYGQVAELPALRQVADAYGLALIEDCAQAIGAELLGKMVGTFGDAACFSLGPGKFVSGGEGGAFVTQSERIWERAMYLSQHPLRQQLEGISKNSFSFSFRIHPLAAAIAAQHLISLPERLRIRRENAHRLSGALGAMRGPVLPPVCLPESSPIFYRYCGSFAGAGTHEALLRVSVERGLPFSSGFVSRALAEPPSIAKGSAALRCTKIDVGIDFPGHLSEADFADWLDTTVEAIESL